MERHAQTILASIITAILIWVGAMVTLSRTDMARLEEKVSGLESRMSDIQAQRYSMQEAAKDFALRDAQLKYMQERLAALEGALLLKKVKKDAE